jgi:membrane protein implicated in regulation of membrane protease activity
VKGLFVRFVVMIVAVVLAAAGFVIAAGFLFAALCIYLGHFLGLAAAAAATAGIAILVSLLLLLIARAIVSRRSKRTEKSAAILGAILGKELDDFSPAKRLLLALAAGFAVGMSPRLRRILFDLL